MACSEDKVIKNEILTTEFGDRVQRIWYECGCMSESDLDENDEKIGTGCFSYCTNCFYGSGYDHNL